MSELYIQYPDGRSMTFHRDDSVTEARSNTCDRCSMRKSLQGGKYISHGDGPPEQIMWFCFECRIDEIILRGKPKA